MNTGEQSIELLRAMAARLRDDERFMAHTLAIYQRRVRLDDAALARELKTAPEMLVRLALCHRPAADAPDFAAQVSALAEFALIDEARLARVIRLADRRLAEASRHGQTVGWWGRLLTRPAFGPRLALAGAAAIGLLLFGALLWRAWRTTPESREIAQQRPQPTLSPNIADPQRTSGEMNDKPRSDARPALPIVPIDLRKHQVQRDAESAGGKIAQLPPSRVRLAFVLPEGRDKGVYQISLLGQDDEVLRTARAHSADGKRLSVTLDLRRFAGRKGSLRIEHLDHPDESPDALPVKIARVAD